MIQLTTACVSSIDETRGNSSNLLFSGQILPERNAGLNGAPTLKSEPGAPCAAAVFDSIGENGRRAAYLAASAFRSAAGALSGIADLEELFSRIHTEIEAAASAPDVSPMGASAVAAVVSGDRLFLACLGSCRAYLLRGRALYLLTRSGAEPSLPAQPAPGDGPCLGMDSVAPYTLQGALQPGDQLLLCTGWLCAAAEPLEMLRALHESKAPGDALLRIVKLAAGARGDMAAVLLKAEEAAK